MHASRSVRTAGSNFSRKLAILAAVVLVSSSAASAAPFMTADGANAQAPTAIENFGPGKTAVYAANYGVTCDGRTDVTASLQKAVAAAQALAFPQSGLGGGRLVLPAGFCMVSGEISITSGISIYGAGAGAGFGANNSGGTVVRAQAGGNVFVVASNDPVSFNELYIDSLSVSGSAIIINGAAANTANIGSQIKAVKTSGFYNSIVFGNAFGWKIHDSTFSNFENDGILLAASASFPDGAIGGSVFSGNTCFNFNVATSQACIEIQGGGDLSISSNKFLNSNYAVLLNAMRGPTGTLLILGNSLEEQHSANIALLQGTPGIQYANVVISGNEIGQQSKLNYANILIDVGLSNDVNTRWMRQVVISSNVIWNTRDVSLPRGMIQINDGQDILVTANVLSAGGSPTTIGVSSYPGASSVKVDSATNLGAAMPAGLGF